MNILVANLLRMKCQEMNIYECCRLFPKPFLDSRMVMMNMKGMLI